MAPNRRDALRSAAMLFPSGFLFALFAAADFWNRKPASEWTGTEVAELMSHSPWAKEINADFTDSGLAPLPTIGRSGAPEAPHETAAGGAKRRQPVVVRWESGQPIRDAGGTPLSPEFADRYVLSVSGLALGIMQKRGGPDSAAAMIDELRAAATLEAKGLAPAQPGVVRPAPRAPGTYLFGFSKELLPIPESARDILFTLQTARVALKAKFDAKTMFYRGRLAL